MQDAALAATRDSLLSIAYVRTGNLPRAESAILEAEQECPDEGARAGVRLAEGVVAVEKGRLYDAERAFQQSLSSARASGDKFQQTQALLNIGVVALRQDHYDDALERFGEASALASAIGARLALEKAAGSAGSTFYKIGDFPRALTNLQSAEEQARSLGSPIDRAGFLYDAGLSQYRMGDLRAAQSSYKQSYELAHSIQNNEETSDALLALGSLSLQGGDLAGALSRAREAERVAEQSGNHGAALQPLLLETQVRERQGDLAGARTQLLGLLQGQAGSEPRPFVRWQIESTLAKLSEEAGDRASAGMWFQRAIETYHQQRSSLSQIESRLPFIENGTGLYLDYMEELLRDGKTKEALLVLDHSRAETLMEGMGTASTPISKFRADRTIDPSAVARRVHGTILVYCLRPQTSYLWVVSPSGSSFFRLPGQEVIQPLVESHNQAILLARDVAAQPNAPGLALYRALIEPAGSHIASMGKVFVIADGELNRLNFETLLAPAPQPHFWIQDVDVVNAKSLSLLASGSAGPRPATATKRLLMVGDPVYSRAEYVKLPNAAQEVADVAGHFAPDQRLVLTGAQATRNAYLASSPGEFRYIHFVTHATASESNPLDSAVILSGQPGAPDTYKLYARDILNSRINADLVTLSACFGSGVRAYSGEGLVGLAWAFLRAGSQNVVGALWEVSDVSTPQLMNDMYAGLAAGESPDTALRKAKLAMMEGGGVFRKPFYWAAFQLYSDA